MPATTYQNASNILSNAILKLSDAYKAANTANDKDTIFAAMEVFQDELDHITAQGLAASTARYKALSDTFKGYKAKLTEVKTEIDTIVKYAKLLSDVASALEKVAKLLG